MPNWCYNKMRIAKKNFEEFKQKYIVDGKFDFNKVIEMPKDLHDTISGGKIDECIGCYLFTTMSKAKAFEEYKKMHLHLYGIHKTYTKTEILLDLWDRVGDHPKMYNSEYENLKNNTTEYTPEQVGKYYYILYQKYGVYDWYQWANKYWGVKWNACNTLIDDEKHTIWFDTAWGRPMGIYEKIAKDNPAWKININAHYECSNETTQCTIVNGMVVRKGE